MLASLFKKDSPTRIFFFSGLLTIAALIAVLILAGPAALIIAIALIVIEVTFSFDNAIINAKILKQLSPFWQKIFLTVGIAIAVFGMRIIFPIAIVAITTSLGWGEVVTLSLNEPEKYANAIEQAEPVIASFGGAFLLMLALHFFINPAKKVHWVKRAEEIMAKVPHKWGYAAVALAAVLFVAFMPANHHQADTLKAGVAGIVIYLIVSLPSQIMHPVEASKKKIVRTGFAGFVGFMYLEILDASFSLDGVIGAFALTNQVLLIAAGLGVGAIWVRSMTVYLTRSNTLDVYRYIEHGAHYAILILALSLLTSLFIDVPEVVTGILGVTVIAASIVASRKAKKEGEAL